MERWDGDNYYDAKTDQQVVMNMRTTLTIELKFDIDPADDAAAEAMRNAAKNAAQVLYTQAIICCGRRKPMIAVRSDNTFSGTDEIEVFNVEDL